MLCYYKVMKRVVLILLSVITIVPSVFATEVTDFLTKIYTEECNVPVKIVSKKEFCNPYEQEIGGTYISAIVYGQANFKVKKHRKTKVSYISVLDKEQKPFWGYVIPH